MTIAEILKAKGISDDVIQAVQDEMKTNKIFTASEENLDIRYGKLKTQHEGKLSELAEAQKLIDELKKGKTDTEGMQQKIAAYDQQIAQLQEQLKEAQLNGEINTALLAAGVKADDIDYVTFKLKAKGELELGEDGHIKGMDDKIAALKTQLPAHFEGAGNKKVIENKLQGNDGQDGGITRESLLKKPYAERMKIYSENPEAYKSAMNN